MREPDHDLLVVGGGIHGAGVAQAAAARGFRVLLLEKSEVAAGTSSRSSKLIHGGLRYLESFDLGLVRESLSERATLLAIAPELVRLVPVHIPVYRDSARPRWKIRAGLTLYALLGNLSSEVRFQALPARAWEGLDGLRTDGLLAVFRYHEAHTDDAALTRAVMASACALGAICLQPSEFLAARRVARGCEVDYRYAGRDWTCTAHALVNAAGPWAEEVLARAEFGARLAVDLVQGTHLVLAGTLSHGIYYAEAPSDRRAVFIMPWQGRTLVGTTEVPYAGSPDAVAPLPEEQQYLLETVCHYLPHHDARVRSAFAGLRVLPRTREDLSRRSREVSLMVDDPAEPRLLSILGGKLTGYRATAERVLEKLRRALPAPPRYLDTREIRLRPES